MRSPPTRGTKSTGAAPEFACAALYQTAADLERPHTPTRLAAFGIAFCLFAAWRLLIRPAHRVPSPISGVLVLLIMIPLAWYAYLRIYQPEKRGRLFVNRDALQ